ncbi:centrosome-associated protein CEP250 [Pezoporus wallicus]|nr:centrosome-associated protein CEP250 [Pezoporus wallicus]
MSSKKELLVRKVAALEVQLSALEQDRQGLSEQLTQARSVNETLENSLSEAQRHILQLEITKSQLEIQLQTVTQANELIQGESLMCFASLDPRGQRAFCSASK